MWLLWSVAKGVQRQAQGESGEAASSRGMAGKISPLDPPMCCVLNASTSTEILNMSRSRSRRLGTMNAHTVCISCVCCCWQERYGVPSLSRIACGAPFAPFERTVRDETPITVPICKSVHIRSKLRSPLAYNFRACYLYVSHSPLSIPRLERESGYV